MGFTIEDMLVVSQDRYKMKMIAGNGGWSNSISWLMMLEDLTIIHNFTGKELAVTTGLGFQREISERRGYAGTGGGIIYTQLLRTDREHRVLCNGNPAVSEGLL